MEYDLAIRLGHIYLRVAALLPLLKVSSAH
jgi:hypothetical protein